MHKRTNQMCWCSSIICDNNRLSILIHFWDEHEKRRSHKIGFGKKYTCKMHCIDDFTRFFCQQKKVGLLNSFFTVFFFCVLVLLRYRRFLNELSLLGNWYHRIYANCSIVLVIHLKYHTYFINFSASTVKQIEWLTDLIHEIKPIDWITIAPQLEQNIHIGTNAHELLSALHPRNLHTHSDKSFNTQYFWTSHNL